MSEIHCSVDKGVLTISLARAQKKNALTRMMYQQMADALTEAQNDDGIKVVLLEGQGDSFTAGNDISDFASGRGTGNVTEVSAFMRALADFEKPVVAKVQGMAVGIGTTMLLHCDLVYAATTSKFVLPFINLALVPEYASSYLLPKLAGHRKASEWLMLGEPFGAREAEQFGLVSQVLEPEQLDAHVQTVCSKLVAKPTFALMQTKQLMCFDRDNIHQYMGIEMDVFLEALTTEAAQEAFDAFLHKRPIDPDKFK
ncbi:enoyl-CoA hydratase [Alteromonas aestuariivivens]|uniref:Enoyl-CoA hydratase n=1 Tax=Alteromonas aestuariivivens TaxID=1938339 RepID=A0A3D8MAS3_9ALTE|nr:enoyl-CoA hydratase [Alteromonas aestuariivivens]RDV27348.1 enoyl-CoA hydratase [Alteromonas aestuariivivens]